MLALKVTSILQLLRNFKQSHILVDLYEPPLSNLFKLTFAQLQLAVK